ncbi:MULTISPECIES: lipid-A-disaccharide synthase-related protein [Dictyoglomus]|jgi:uncharacterized protein (TIGR03492 family)|uniref:Lipid-A-disaccharide synthase n=1 Tax=Dictyoglomus turgidum (strain DSM 6724 / Z-1310) TaxID=515635 RepID=B8E1H0_DICTD|nr:MULTISPECIES: lipid-A-disaccharide synthase-related protein [Dictyoglomus]ACK41495.1 conserved hypothetical protein [Dictyoglomus turgidum DSM 6724]PNV79359.1 MAG: hypothetical protein C0196_06135 [Dictyoglomus turgidum]HBU31884.1 hypothetical protein [Dictyoglomus sp.]
MKRILFISNGYGEDYVAVNVAKEILNMEPSISIEGLPIVGEGNLYINSQIPIIGPHKFTPSGGFLSSIRTLVKDVREGLIKLHYKQLKSLKEWLKEDGIIIAVGDIVPLALAVFSKKPFFFISIQKSVYYVINNNYENIEKKEAIKIAKKAYLLEYYFMKNNRLLKVFPRDKLSYDILKLSHINAEYLGNPMMDGLEPTGRLNLDKFENYLKVLLLPGSRIPEAYNNFNIILNGIFSLVHSDIKERFLFLTALAKSINMSEVSKILDEKNFTHIDSSEDYMLYNYKNHFLLLTNLFNDCIHQAQIGICMAGTATEQFVGLGKPVIVIPGKGPQYTKKFAYAQKRLLGPSLFIAENPKTLPNVFKKIYKNEKILKEVHENGKRRMGEKGASQKIAESIIKTIKGG